MKTEIDYLKDILDSVSKIRAFTEEGKEVFYRDDKTQYAVIRCYEIIGEVVKRLDDDLLQHQPQVPWKKIKGFRDFLAHNYDEITIDIIWQSIEQLDDLQQAVEALLAHLADKN